MHEVDGPDGLANVNGESQWDRFISDTMDGPVWDGVQYEPGEDPHGPYCALCGECQGCAEREPGLRGKCWDSANGEHRWNRVEV
jgi:hypothetical protein